MYYNVSAERTGGNKTKTASQPSGNQGNIAQLAAEITDLRQKLKQIEPWQEELTYYAGRPYSSTYQGRIDELNEKIYDMGKDYALAKYSSYGILGRMESVLREKEKQYASLTGGSAVPTIDSGSKSSSNAALREEALREKQRLSANSVKEKTTAVTQPAAPTAKPAPAEKPVVQDVTDRGKLEQLGQQITNRVNNWINNYNGYFDNYNTRFGNRKGDLTDSYVSDSQQWLDNATKQAEAFAVEAGEIKSTLNQYGKYFNPEWVSNITKALDEAMAQGEQVLNIARKDNEYWSSWGNPYFDKIANGLLAAKIAGIEDYNSGEQAYKKAQREEGYRQKYAGKSGTELVNLINFIDDENEKAWVTGEALRTLSFDEAAKDLEVMKAEKAEIENSGTLINHYDQKLAMTTEQQKAAVAAKLRRADIYKKYGVEDLDGLKNLIARNEQMIAESKHVQEYVRLSSVQENKDFEKYVKIGRAEADAYSEENNKTEHMTASEVKVLAYYIAKDREKGTNLAEQYKQTIKHYLKHRRAGEIADSINGIDIPVIEGVTRIGYGLGAGAVDWAMGTAQNFTDKKLDPTVMQIANSYVGSDPELNWVDRTLHRAATTTGKVLPSILISKGVGGATGFAPFGKAVGSMAMYLGSAGNAYGDALEKGYDKPAARTYSALVGISEVTLQNILGGIGEFGGLPAKLDGKISAIKNALLKGAAKFAVSEIGEISEEVLQNYLEPAFRTIIFGEEYDMPTVQELIDTALTTFITTGTLEGPGITSETIKEHSYNNALDTAKNPVKPAQPPQNLPELKFTDTEIQSIQSIGRKSVNSFTEQDAAATEKLAQRHWEELGEKSPFYRAKNGDWRETEQTAVQIATKPDATRGVQKNADTGWDIQVSGKVFNETKVHTDSYNVAARAYLPYINDIVKKAVLLDSYAIDSGKTKSQNSLMMHSMYAVADIGKGPEVLKLYVEEVNDPNSGNTIKRCYQLQNTEKYRPAGKSSQKTASSISPAAGNNITVADLFAAVKAKDAAFQPKTAQKTTNGKVGWDGREVVTEATGSSITMGRKKYEFLGYDKNGSPVYQDAEILADQSKQSEEKSKQTDDSNPMEVEDGQNEVENSENGDIITTKGIGIQFFANKSIQKQSDRELRKSMSSWKSRLAEHTDWLSNPKLHDQYWDEKTPRHKAGLLKHWQHEIENFKNNLKEAEDELKKRGNYDD